MTVSNLKKNLQARTNRFGHVLLLMKVTYQDQRFVAKNSCYLYQTIYHNSSVCHQKKATFLIKVLANIGTPAISETFSTKRLKVACYI